MPEKITCAAYHDLMADTYDDEYKAPYWKLYNAITWHYISECLDKLPDNAWVLDAGGGTALWAIRVAECGFRVVMTDIAAGMLKVAQDKIEAAGLSNQITLCNVDVVDMGCFANGQFDLCLAEGDTVSYCDDPEKAIAELARVTKPGGYLTVSVDNKLNWVSQYLRKGEIDNANRLLKTGRTDIPVQSGEAVFPAYMFTFEDLEILFLKNAVMPRKMIGKPVWAPFHECLEDEDIFKKYLDVELKFGSHPSVAGRGGHIALVGFKQYM